MTFMQRNVSSGHCDDPLGHYVDIIVHCILLYNRAPKAIVYRNRTL